MSGARTLLIFPLTTCLSGSTVETTTLLREIPVNRSEGGRAAELGDLYEGVVHGRRLFHDGRWGRATLEACLGILESARTHRDVEMRVQVAL